MGTDSRMCRVVLERFLNYGIVCLQPEGDWLEFIAKLEGTYVQELWSRCCTRTAVPNGGQNVHEGVWWRGKVRGRMTSGGGCGNGGAICNLEHFAARQESLPHASPLKPHGKIME